MAALQPGRLLARRYRLIDQIGAGGMSVIWRARDEVLDRVVAVKVLAPSLAADARFRDMVREEARSAAQLVHPHVTAVHDYGETLAPDGEITSFVVMELLNGEELENRLSEGPLPWPEAVEVGAQVAEALAAAHRLGIVHRDITPANVMMTRVGAKVLDFGIATQVGAPDEDEDGGTFGTPAYVAPERLDGSPAQPATDVYSLGVLLYETLTGQVPYPADTWEELGTALQSDEALSLDGVPGLPPAVARTCLRCLARDPRDRPTAHQVAAALRDQMLPGDPQAATMLSPTVTLPALATAPEAAEPAPAARPGTRRPLVVVGALALVVAAAVLIAPTLTPRSPAPPVDALPTTTPAPELPVVPDDEVTVPSAGPTTTATSTSPPPRPRPAPDGGQGAGGLTEAAERLRTLIDDGVRNGDIRGDVGVDLRNVLANLTREAADGRSDLAEPVAQFREKVTRRVQEGAITPAFARHLDAAIVGLDTSQG
ncbi:serine/threonine-protein kinase [Micromonospora halophytica]|uniref:non-specific serine/threonine protein kinase n=1 Tax=Micromonospora halophytica TaxID=47864 RepID=A0A1C5GJA3_9ACTN|nr:serine/threonine-protein kinase [Micromonospora halophytica]SCG33894.1 serine/threonine protein kinase [Micromonospora halophytica]